MPKISELPDGDELTGNELVDVVQNGVNVKMALKTLLNAPRNVSIGGARWIGNSAEPGVLNATNVTITQVPVTLNASVSAIANQENILLWDVTYTANDALIEDISDVWKADFTFDGNSQIPLEGNEGLVLGPGRWKIVSESGEFNEFGANVDLVWVNNGYLHTFDALSETAFLTVLPGHTETIKAQQNQSWFTAMISVYKVGDYEKSAWSATIQPFGTLLSITVSETPSVAGVITAKANLYDPYGGIVGSSNDILAFYTQ